MKKLLKMAVTPVLALGLSALISLSAFIMPVSGANYLWSNAEDDLNYTTIGNWLDDADEAHDDLPGTSDRVFIENGDTVTVSSAGAESDKLAIYGDSTLVVNAAFRMKGDLRMADGTLIIENGFIDMEKEDLKQDNKTNRAGEKQIGDALIEISGTAGGILMDDMNAGYRDGTNMVFNLSGSAQAVFDDWKTKPTTSTMTITVTDNTKFIVEDRMRNETAFSIVTIDGPGTTYRIDDHLRFEGGNHTFNLLNGAQGSIGVDQNQDFQLSRKGSGTTTANIFGGSDLVIGDDLELGRGDASVVFNIADDSTVTVGVGSDCSKEGKSCDLDLRDNSSGSGTSRVFLSDDAVLTVEHRVRTGNADAGEDWIDFADNAVMIMEDTEQEGDVQAAIAENFFTVQTVGGGYVDYFIRRRKITVFRRSAELTEIPNINITSQGVTPIHLQLIDVDLDTLQVSDPTLAGTPVSPVHSNVSEGEGQTVLQVSTQEMIANGVLNGDTTSLLVTGAFNSGARFSVIGALNASGGGLAAVSAVPEPASLILLGLGSMGLMFRRRR